MKKKFLAGLATGVVMFGMVSVCAAGDVICSINPATGECFGERLPLRENLNLGACLNCGDGIFKGNKMNVVFDNGSIRGIWGTGGTTILSIETNTGKRIQFDTNPNGASFKLNNPHTVAIWGTGGTTREITEYITQEDMAAIWGTGGTTFDGIWGTGGTTITSWDIDGDSIFIMYDDGQGNLGIAIDIDERATVLVSPEPPPFQ
ncbi:MAG: hypothetical protein KKE17_13120 [Proteobacteria bacterium]|nr:hypothetical protein [Pseudomonadota bacterium]MBU1710937.1 hypothetical protein [Pseudomonadota bacterium]